MLTPCTCKDNPVYYDPCDIISIFHVPCTPSTVSAVTDRAPVHGVKLQSGRRRISACAHNRSVFVREQRETAKYNPFFVDPLQGAFL